MHSIEQCLRRLWTLEKLVVPGPPGLELYSLPAPRQMLLQYRQRILQLLSAQHVHVEIPAAVRVGAEDATAEEPLDTLQGLEIAPVHADLQRRLLGVAGKRAFPDDEPHGIAQIERLHEGP